MQSQDDEMNLALIDAMGHQRATFILLEQLLIRLKADGVLSVEALREMEKAALRQIDKRYLTLTEEEPEDQAFIENNAADAARKRIQWIIESAIGDPSSDESA